MEHGDNSYLVNGFRRITAPARRALARFRKDMRGSIMVEAVIVLPLLFWALAATYEFFEIHRYKSVREKAAYTVADMLSRELSGGVNAVYLDNVKALFDEITGDDGNNQLRVSVIRYDSDEDVYAVSWSRVRGTGSGLEPLGDADVSDASDALPIMFDGQEIVLVESRSRYQPALDVGFQDNLRIDNRVFTALRFAARLRWEDGQGNV